LNWQSDVVEEDKDMPTGWISADLRDIANFDSNTYCSADLFRIFGAAQHWIQNIREKKVLYTTIYANEHIPN